MPATEPSAERTALSEVLIAAVREAGALALATFQRPLKTWTKANGSPVCEADVAVDHLLRERLGAAAPDYGWLSEESADDRARLSTKRVWIVDPIDGTRAYVRGLPDWTIAAALVEIGRPVLGVVFAPVEQALFSAVAGSGARLNGVGIRASDGANLRHSRVAGPRRHLEALAAAAPGIEMVPKIHSLALRLARVAEGTLDAALAAHSSHDWDLAAADLLVHEAGGALTTVEGRVPAYNQAEPVHGVLLAAGRCRHRVLIELVNAGNWQFA